MTLHLFEWYDVNNNKETFNKVIVFLKFTGGEIQLTPSDP